MSTYLLISALVVLLALSAGSFEWSKGHLTSQKPEGPGGAIASAAFFILAVGLVVVQHTGGSMADHAVDALGAAAGFSILWYVLRILIRIVTLLVRSWIWLWNNFVLHAKRT